MRGVIYISNMILGMDMVTGYNTETIADCHKRHNLVIENRTVLMNNMHCSRRHNHGVKFVKY